MHNSLLHLIWIPLAGLVSFLVPFLFGDLVTLPVDLYYFVYFVVMSLFFYIYARKTALDLKKLISHRLIWAILAGIIMGLLMMQNVLSRPETVKLHSAMLWWGILWRGIIYGTVDGLLLFAFPWVVTWRAINGFEQQLPGKIGAALLAWIFMLVITTCYHLGYDDFRSQKIVQPNIGTTITAIPTLITANPAASTIAHVFLHVTAVVHSPETELFLPPHRDDQS